jgi:hypothetical protein
MKLTGQRNQCQGCKQYFNSNTAFEKHRTGKHGKDRRCRTEEEMTAKGMSLNAKSFWVSETNDRFNKEISDDNEAD